MLCVFRRIPGTEKYNITLVLIEICTSSCPLWIDIVYGDTHNVVRTSFP